MTSSFDHASDDCNRRRGALLLRVSVGDYNPHRKTECPPPPTEAGDIGDLVINHKSENNENILINAYNYRMVKCDDKNRNFLYFN